MQDKVLRFAWDVDRTFECGSCWKVINRSRFTGCWVLSRCSCSGRVYDHVVSAASTSLAPSVLDRMLDAGAVEILEVQC